MRYVPERNIYVRINRHLEAYGMGQKLHKNRSRSTDAKGSYYLELPDGSVVENVKLEQLARRLGCLTKYEKVGVPPKRSDEEAKLVIEELASNIAGGRAYKKRLARHLSEVEKL